uniref:B box-type domain-containing protein n=1 Tax=Solanum lycopersicum TaxID=4081 RepID=A0A3Q7J1Z2_SOLLC
MCNGRREIDEEKIEELHNIIVCELCKSEAYVYCEADNAFLCKKCDKLVHTANFFAQRHIRCILCGICKKLTKRYLIGVSHEVILLKVVRCTNFDEQNCSTKVKEPFLFL